MGDRECPRANPILVLTAGGILTLLLVWPLASRYSVVHDEHIYCILSRSGRTFLENLQLIWADRQYRVLDLVAGYVCDPNTLDARWTMVLQVPPLLAILWCIREVGERLSPRSRSIFPLAIIWFGLHAATAVSLWLPTVGQTWGAATGLLLGIATWDAAEHLIRGAHIGRRTWATIVIAGVVGPHIKETYYGWAASVALAALVAGIATRRIARNWGAWTALLLAILVPALLHGAARFVWGGLAQATHHQGRYSVHFGTNLGQNIALSIAGQLAMSPVHYVRLPAPLSLLAYAGIGLSAVLVGAFICWVKCRRVWALVLATSFLAVSVTWPMQRISELYFMGPNAGAAVAASIGAVGLWRLRPRIPRALGRGIVISAFAVGALGFVSRSRHFRVTWNAGRVLYAQARNYQASLPSGGEVRSIGLAPELARGWQHSQYVMPPANALNPPAVERLLNQMQPDKPVRILVLPSSEPCCDLALNGAMLPASPAW
ncbi:MAG: hypothetical protein ACM3ZE_03420 [Myxococcales bacterium]